jgi:uncharacterized protein (DUF1330 family)
MAKAYLIAYVTVTDPDAYAVYAELATAAQAAHGARVLARGGRTQQLEGAGRPRNVVLEFDSLEAALTYYRSDDYQRAMRHRQGAGEADICVVEGV